MIVANQISTNSTSSPASSTDDDAFNSAEAKVHFGPVTSPEKRIAAAVEKEQAKEENFLFPPARASPLRRSPRLSTPVPPSIKEIIERREGVAVRLNYEAFSRAATPENEGIAQDEPSSVLASRIMRAQDNPSPPPQSSEPSSSSSKLLDIPAFSFTASPPPDPLFIYANYERPSTPNFIYHSMPDALSPIPASPPQHADLAPDSVTEGVSESPQPPLISLDSFIPFTNTPALFNSPGRSSNPLLALDQTPFPDVPTLSPIPVPAVASHDIRTPCFTESLVPGESESSNVIGLPKTPDAVEERIVADALIVDPETGQNSAIIPAVPSASEGRKDAETQQTPLRRSTLPRRSTVAYGSPLREDGQESALASPGSLEQGEISNLENTYSTKESAKRNTFSPRRIIQLSRQNTETIPGTPLQHERSPRKVPSRSKRELGSLSPSSVSILGSLLSAPSSPSRETQDTEPAAESKTLPQSLVPILPNDVPSVRPTPPIRFPSPKKPTSSNKFRLQPADPSDPNRTPARRIPVQDAVARGQISPQKGAQIMFGSRPIAGGSKPPVLKIPPADSPARRVMVSDNSVCSPSRRLGSPVRSRSLEPRPTEPLQLKQRGSSVEPISLKGKAPSRPTLFSRSGSADRLPYPIVANMDIRAPIPEEHEPADKETQAQPILPSTSSQYANSRLKQPTSKIPRIGLKPYAKPASASKVPEISRVQGKNVTALRKVDWLKPPLEPASTSKTKLPAGSAEVGQLKPSTTSQKASSSPMKSVTASSSTLLKRKRGLESPTKLTPVVLLPTMRNHSVSSGGSPVKKPGLNKLREDKNKHDKRLPRISQAVQEASSQDNTSESALPASDLASSSSPLQDKQLSLVPSDDPPTHSSIQPEQLIVDSSPSSPSSSSPAIPEAIFRRSTRNSRNVQFTMKVEPPRRRKNVMTFQDNGPFSSMSAVALRALTNSNTTKNQKYLAATLETEVIRKEGPRPESPVMKVKTIVQKEKEERSRDRNARAERRATRRQPESSKESNDADLQNTDTDEDDLDASDSSPSPQKHARGPGDEEDYESPVHPAKRPRLDDVVVEEVEIPGKKRVKWDRGLCKEIYIDDVQPRRVHLRTTKENVKGCLAPTAKALTLDNLGNLPNAESPLKELVQENIVVKKFVYDNDLEPIVSTPTPAVVKNTRSKSKKSKS